MSTRSKPLGGAPLNRAWLDSAASPTRAFFGAVFLSWSWISTVLIVGPFLRPLMSGSALGILSDAALAAFVFAVLISFIEFVSADRWPLVYWSVLFLFDAPFTAWQTHAWLDVLLAPHMELTTGKEAVIWAVSIIGGIIAARFGEVFLFGRRRYAK